MNRRGLATDVYFIFLGVVFLLLGFYIISKVGSSFAQENPGEGFGFRQSAVSAAFTSLYSLVDYSNYAAKLASQKAFLDYTSSGFKNLLFEGGTPTPCGSLGSYPLWNNKYGDECFMDQNKVPDSFKVFFNNELNKLWSNKLLPEPPNYELFIDGGSLVGIASDYADLPILGAYDDLSENAYSVADRASSAGLDEGVFSPDTSLDVIIKPDNDHRLRHSKPDYIVLHYTAGSSLSSDVDTFLKGPLSVHYIVGRDGRIVQMVPESYVAYHAGGCKSGGVNKCAINNMNERSIGIEIVNRGFLALNSDNPAVIIDNKCPEGYVIASRRCDYASYNPDFRKQCHSISRKYHCWQEFTDAQLDAVFRLVTDIASRNGITVDHIIGHEEIKAEKSDPGPAFPWDDLRSYVSSHNDVLRTDNLKLSSDNLVAPVWSINNFLWPVSNRKILGCVAPNNDFLFLRAGGAVKAVTDGIVYSVVSGSGCECNSVPCNCKDGGSGNSLVIKHNDRLFIKYSFLRSTSLKEGDGVREGDVIGEADIFGLQVFDSEIDLHNTENSIVRNPLCYFSQDNLNKLLISPDAAGCSSLFNNGKLSVDKVSGPLASECAASGSSSSIPKVIDKALLWKVERTRKNIINYGLSDTIISAAKKYGVDKNFLPFLLAIISQESEADPYAVSPTGCSGIGQFCLSTAMSPKFSNFFKHVKACHCRKTNNELPFCDAKIHDSDCDIDADDRFKAEKAVPATALFLYDNLKDYKDYDDRYYFAAARYNSGEGRVVGSSEPGLRAGIRLCSNDGEPKWDCVKKYVRPEGRNYADAVVALMAVWGGAVPGINTITSSNGVFFRTLGSLKFKLNFRIPFKGFLDVTKEVRKKASDILNSVDDDLQKAPSLFLDDDYASYSFGFCDGLFSNFLSDVIWRLQECKINGQSSCVCSPFGDDADGLPNGNYVLKFHDTGLVELTSLSSGSVLASFYWQPLTAYGFESASGDDVFEVSGISIPFTVDNNILSIGDWVVYKYVKDHGSVSAKSISLKGEVSGFYKMFDDDLFGIYETPDNPWLNTLCLPTKQLAPFCAHIKKPILFNGVSVSPTVRFGLTLNDYNPPKPLDFSLSGSVSGLNLSLVLDFDDNFDSDLSGALVYCSEGPFVDGRPYYPVRVPVDELSNNLVLSSCNGALILPGIPYYVKVVSFDYGANEGSPVFKNFSFDSYLSVLS